MTNLNKVSYRTLFGVTRLLPLHKKTLTSHVIEFVFSMFGRIWFILWEKEADVLILKLMTLKLMILKNLYNMFSIKTQHSSILTYWSVVKKIWRGNERGLNKLNQGKSIALPYHVGNFVVLGHPLTIIKWDWGNFFPKILKWLTARLI